MTKHESITWGDIARMLACSDQAEALAEANAAIAFVLPGYEWGITRVTADPLDKSKLNLEARPVTVSGEALCPEDVRDAVWDHNPDAPDPVTPLVKAYRAWRKVEAAENEENNLVKDSGPYEVSSLADGTILIRPSWPNCKPYTDEDGGGPGLCSRMALALEVQRVLNEVAK